MTVNAVAERTGSTEMTKKERAIAAARAGVTAARRNMQENKRDLARKGVAAFSAYLLGSATLPGANGQPRINAIPQVMGLPRIATLALVTQGASMLLPQGVLREGVAGVADSSTSIALFQWGAGRPLAGVAGADGPRPRRAVAPEVRRLEAELSELDALERTGRESLV